MSLSFRPNRYFLVMLFIVIVIATSVVIAVKFPDISIKLPCSMKTVSYFIGNGMIYIAIILFCVVIYWLLNRKLEKWLTIDMVNCLITSLAFGVGAYALFSWSVHVPGIC